MSVTVSFQPQHTHATAGEQATLSLNLINAGDAEEVVRLTAQGSLAEHVAMQSETIYLDAGESFDVPVTVAITPSLTAGPHVLSIEAAIGDGATQTAEATIEVAESSSYTVSMTPARSMSPAAGKHHLDIENTGNTPIGVELTAVPLDNASTIELAAPVVNVDPGKNARVELKVKPRERFWTGPRRDHPFHVTIVGTDQATHELSGTYDQGPRVGTWVLPALLGMLGSLLLFLLLWFLVLRPDVESIAEDAAADAVAAQQEVFDMTVDELEAAAERATALPLGTPADLRLNASAPAGGTANESFTVAADRVLSVTDVVFQNPDGAVGRVALVRSGEVLLESQLANFRDLDLHFVAPFRFDGSDTVELTLECETPGPSSTDCNVGASIVGFVDSNE